MTKQVQQLLRIFDGRAGDAVILERCPIPTQTNCRVFQGILLLKVPDGVLASACADPGAPIGVLPGVFSVRDALVCVILVVVGDERFPVYVNLLDQEVAAGLKAMANQGFVYLGICDEKGGFALLESRPPVDIFTSIIEVHETAEKWTLAQYREAQRGFEHAFDDDAEELLAAIGSDANIALARCLMNRAAAEGTSAMPSTRHENDA